MSDDRAPAVDSPPARHATAAVVLRLALRNLVRDLKSGELAVLLLALLLAVASLTAVGFFTSRVGRAVIQQAGGVLAADLRLESARPIGDEYEREAARRGLRTARIVSMPSVVFVGDESSLVALRAVSDGYPLRGELRVSDRPFGPAGPAHGIPQRGEAWADSRLLARLGAQLGARLTIGAHPFVLSQVLDYRPDQSSGFADLTTTLLINLADLDATGLVQPGSRVTRSMLFAGSPAEVDAFRAYLDAHKRPGERLQSIADASPQIRASSDRAGRFLALASMVSVLLAAVAVAMAARRYASRHLDQTALMKCMGATQQFVLLQTVLQLLIVAVAVAVAGAAIGYGAQALLSWMVRDLVSGVLPAPAADSWWLGLVTTVAILVGFALPPLLQMRRVPPARVLRRNLEPPPLRYAVVSGLAVAAILGLLYWLVRDAKLMLYLGAGIGATFAVLALAGALLVRALRPLRAGVGVAWRYGLANVARRGRDSVIQIVAFGLGLMVLLLLALVRNDLLAEWRATLPTGAPNYFMINIRPDEGEALRAFFAARGLPPTELVPMVRARLAAVNDVPIERLHFENDDARDWVEREANLTWTRQLRDDNRIVAGQWWRDGDGGGARISLEREFAERLSLRIGDRLRYDVAGEPVEARVASLREVRWDSFQPNFFVVFSPGVLDDVTGTLITSVHVTPEQRPALVELVRRFPEVTIVDIDALLTQVRTVMDKAALAVQYVFAFTLLAGLIVLAASVQATRDERRYESAVLRTLGASRRVVFAGVASEFMTLGALAGLLAAVGASIVGAVLAREVFDLKYSPGAMVWVAGLAGGALLVGAAGLVAARSVVTHPPMESLRG
jgi:putative ABC transport system permease protein